MKWSNKSFWSLAEFNHYICQCYPQVSLNLVGCELARADRGKKLQKVQVASFMLKMAIGKSRLYVIPLVYQRCIRYVKLYKGAIIISL